MFCESCKTELKPNDKFCPNCGQAVDPNNQTVMPPSNMTSNFKAKATPYLKEILPLLKAMTLTPLETVTNGVKNLSKELSFLFTGVNIFLFALLNTLFFKSVFNKSLPLNQLTNNSSSNDMFGFGNILNESQKAISNSFSFTKLFFYILFAALIFSAIMLLLAFILFKVIGKQENFNILYALNCISLSSITLIAFMLCGFILSLISYKLGLFVIAIGTIAFIIILFNGFKALDTGNNSWLLVYLYAVSIALSNFIYFQILLSFVKASIQQMIGGLFNF